MAKSIVGTDSGGLMAEEMSALMSELFPICRSITGDGSIQSLEIIRRHIPLTIHEVASGTKCFDWTVPDEWNIRDAYIMDKNGKRVIDFKENNLHVLGYSEPFEGTLTLDQLKPHLYTRPDLPEAIPYMTSYYARRWGFCLSHRQFEALKPGKYRIKIDSTLEPGSMTYGELLIPGESEREILLSTYICHPSMANNELSGPVVTTFLTRHILHRKNRRYSYRILFLPETIGSIYYLSRHLEELKKKIVAGYVVTCVGGPGQITYLKSRAETSLVDKVTEHVLKHQHEPYRILDYTRRASDERQYCAPGIDLPVGSLMKTRYFDYPEYHTSLDNLDFVTGEQLEGSFWLYIDCLTAMEKNCYFQGTILCEPNLGKRGLYPTLGAHHQISEKIDAMQALLSYSDGNHDLVDIAEKQDKPVSSFYETTDILVSHGLLQPCQ